MRPRRRDTLPALPATVGGRLVLASAVSRDEEPAVRALEASVALGLAGDQLRREGLLAVRADDLLRACLIRHLGHPPKVPGSLGLREEGAVRVERCAFRYRRLASGGPEMDQPDEALAVR